MSRLARGTGVCLLVLLVLATPGPAVAAPDLPDAATLRQRASAWGAVEVALTARMVTHKEGREPFTADLRILRAGRTRTRIDFLAPPKDAGKVLLQLGDQAWLYLPKADRVVKVPPRRNLLADGLLFEDLFAEEPGAGVARVEEADGAYILVTTPAGTGSERTEKSTRIFFHRDTLLPFKREFYGSSGRLLRTITIEETRPWQDQTLPWKIRFEDNLRNGTETTLEVLAAEELPGNIDELLSRERLAQAPPAAGSTAHD